MKKRFALAMVLMTIFYPFIHAQTSVSDKIDLHINCNSCDMNYLRQEIDYVNHVRDQALADVQVFINRIGNGSGGGTYELSFTGKNQYEYTRQGLTYTTNPTMTNDEVRAGLLKYIEGGLVSYLLQAGMTNEVLVSIEPLIVEQKVAPIHEDPWNYWIFDVRGEANMEKESNQSGVDLEFGFGGDRITEEWRVRSDAELNYTENRFKNDGEEIISVRKFHYLSGSVVNSLGDHWSAGLFGGLKHDTYNNIDFSYNVGPALEYNIFPYHEVIRREITFAYKIGYIENSYLDSTLYSKLEESLFNQSLTMEARFRQPWGDISSTVRASNYLHDFSKNRVELDSYVSVRLFKGFALSVSTEMDLIRDQITLPAKGASLEDLLLRQRQIATNFRMEFGVGFRYTFGAAFNNIVNTRL